MDSITTKLSGNLGERHRCINALVHEAHRHNSFPLQTHPEESALDRLFKIDLASKQRNVDFIIQTLKDDDMLYVSRALKCLWLLDPEYSNIVNPIYLEHELFPLMILTAVNKMKRWIQIHLKDLNRCEEFYQFYKDKNFDYVAKFLWHSSSEYILGQTFDVLDKITPKRLKRLSEKTPLLTKIFYENLKHYEANLIHYLKNDLEFFATLKYILKTDADVFFYVLENFFVHRKFVPLNAATTKYIMQHHKNRFLCKPELYSAWFLDIPTQARYLDSEEIKDLVMKLARAEYLQPWFSYKNVEPLIKRLGVEERTAFKNLVFINKKIGPTVKEWPYPIPVPPELPPRELGFFEEKVYEELAECRGGFMDFRCMLKKRKYARWCPTKSLLDQLFEKYRFRNYNQILPELQKQLKAESSSQNRQHMFLVLVSKTGGRTDDVVSFLDLLIQYKNEPVHVRAAIIRSLVKRAFVWRLPEKHWERLLEFAHGLGLEGSTPESDCNEGLHGVIIRDLLADVKPSEPVWERFLNNHFNSLLGYSLTADERRVVRARLPQMLLADVKSKTINSQLSILQKLLDTLKDYHIKFCDLPGLVDTVVSIIKCAHAGGLTRQLKFLYDAGIARDRVTKEYFEIIQTDASYVNALRHDISILDTEKMVKLIEDKNLKHERFHRKLALYFTENDGLRDRYLTFFELRAASEPHKILTRPLALVSGSNFLSCLKVFDAAAPKTAQRQFAAALRSNAHLVRPAFDLETFGWHRAGAKAVANRISVSRQSDVERYVQECLSWRRSMLLALVLAKRVSKEQNVFEVLASKRPGTSLKAALRYFCREGNKSDPRIWQLVKAHILKGNKRKLHHYIEITDNVPTVIKPEYCFFVYKACIRQKLPDLIEPAISKIPAVVCELDDKYVFEAVDIFLRECCSDSFEKFIDEYGRSIFYFSEIVAKFLVLSTSEEILDERFKKVGIPFLNRLEVFWNQSSPDYNDMLEACYLNEFLFYLRYNKAFFDVKNVTCLKLFERITEWLHKFLPIWKFFDKYVTVHLHMIYFKTAKICLKQKPALLSESTKENIGMLATIFGKILANEIEDLANKYFDSISELYQEEIVAYISRYFDVGCPHELFEIFIVSVLKELLANQSASAYSLAKYVFKNECHKISTDCKKDILKKLNESVDKDFPLEIDDYL